MSEPHILVVDDHRDIRESLASYLRKHGMRVSQAANAAAARGLLEKHAIDLIVLDIMMPGEDGLSLCRHIREAHDTPVVVLTAMADDTDRIVGLEVGADDYVTKPFNPRELLARVKNVLRRANTLPKKQRQTGPKRYVFDRWILDSGRRELIGDDGVAMMLSAAEFRLLLALAQRPRLVLSRDQLLDLTSGRGAQAFDRSIDNQISRLRRKVERDPADPQLIKTVWGDGYQLAADVEEAS
ncbi:response regulator [Bradyrhizobium sp.]|uniref:response regulator n=2 Tax=Bradyrhizobium sp. TaxID=376 RepID=UPI001DB1865A|nr:response regulator [Bradyrhizobium sp.]MBV8696980.1 response regulator [Bradyrhizobium sp.]MBV8916974.1 response regulator [Bradyrhizobium sp.]MBV9981724.1 response regulator [Bradyrhizobium sp.]